MTICKINLVDVPEMKHLKDTKLDGQVSPTGEICVFGPILFSGYFANKKATEECLDKDGWFHTGDICRIMPGDKGLKIIDRKKRFLSSIKGSILRLVN